MGQTVNWNTKQVVKDTLEDEINDDSIDILLKSGNDDGGNKNTIMEDTRTEVQIEENETRELERADITHSSFNKEAVVRITIRSRDSKSKTQSTWETVVQALLNNRNRLEGLDGGWDRIELEDLSVDDPTFQKHTAVIQVRFIAPSQAYDGSVGQ